MLGPIYLGCVGCRRNVRAVLTPDADTTKMAVGYICTGCRNTVCKDCLRAHCTEANCEGLRTKPRGGFG